MKPRFTATVILIVVVLVLVTACTSSEGKSLASELNKAMLAVDEQRISEISDKIDKLDDSEFEIFNAEFEKLRKKVLQDRMNKSKKK